jgi:hypothetical protein
MRHSIRAVSVTVLVGVGMVTARLAAQTGEQATVPLSQRVQSSLNRALSPVEVRQLQQLRQRLQQELQHPRTPMDCGMPAIKGDPAIDPEIVKQPPPAKGVTHTMRVLEVPKCPESIIAR